MTPRQVTDFIRYHGVVLQAAKGLEPTLTARIVGEPIRGSWWGHPASHEIFALIQHVHASKAVLVCTLADGRITCVHRRLWAFFVRVAEKFPKHSLDMVREIHLPSGRHERRDIPFPEWVPEPVLRTAAKMRLEDAAAEVRVWLDRYGAN